MNRWAIAVAALVAEYLIISALFDAHELVPAALRGIGDLAPLPLVVVAALLALRSAAPDAPGAVNSPSVATQPAAPLRLALLALHAVLFGAFVAASFAVRANNVGGGAGWTATVAWGVLLLASSLTLAAALFDRAHLRALAAQASAPVLVALLVGGAAWGAGRVATDAWSTLAPFTIRPVAALIGAVAPDLVVDVAARQVGTQRFSVLVDPLCSGHEGMGLLLVLLGAFVWMFRSTLRFPLALALPVLGLVVGYGANVLRIVALIAVGTLGHADIAVRGFHSKAGWLLFCAIALGLTMWARRSAIWQRTPTRDTGDNPTVPFVLPLVVFVAASLVVGLFDDGSIGGLELVAAPLAAFALWRGRSAWWDRANGVIVGVIVGAGVALVWWLLVPDSTEASVTLERSVADASRPARGAWLIARLVTSIAVVPLVEELAFRGYLMRRFVRADFDQVAFRDVQALPIILSSAAFGAVHGAFVAGGVAGLAYAWCAVRTGALLPAVVAHAVTNALLAMWILATGRMGWWA